MAKIIQFPNLRMRKGIFAVGACFSPRVDPVYLWSQESRRVAEMVMKARLECDKRRAALLAEEARRIRQKAAEDFRSWFHLIVCSSNPKPSNLRPLLRIVGKGGGASR